MHPCADHVRCWVITGGSNITGAGLSLSSGGVISGNPTDVSSNTTVSFDVRATANSKNTDRSFSLIVKDSFAWDVLSGISSSGGNDRVRLKLSADKRTVFMEDLTDGDFNLCLTPHLLRDVLQVQQPHSVKYIVENRC